MHHVSRALAEEPESGECARGIIGLSLLICWYDLACEE
jgi:hypothetical protein